MGSFGAGGGQVAVADVGVPEPSSSDVDAGTGSSFFGESEGSFFPCEAVFSVVEKGGGGSLRVSAVTEGENTVDRPPTFRSRTFTCVEAGAVNARYCRHASILQGPDSL